MLFIIKRRLIDEGYDFSKMKEWDQNARDIILGKVLPGNGNVAVELEQIKCNQQKVTKIYDEFSSDFKMDTLSQLKNLQTVCDGLIIRYEIYLCILQPGSEYFKIID